MNEEIIRNMVRDILELKAEVRRLASLKPLFDIKNQANTATLTADQNDFDPGNYDVLFINTNAARIITGFTGGSQGRFLYLINNSGFTITLPNNSGSSAVANRIFMGGGAASLIMQPFSGTGVAQSVLLYHTGGAWLVIFKT